MSGMLMKAAVGALVAGLTVLGGADPGVDADDGSDSQAPAVAAAAVGALAERTARAVAPTAVSPECARTVLRYGSRGYCVTELQFNLNILFGLGLAMDGSYGPATTSAVYWFQGRYGLTYDGITGPQTWGKVAWCLERARSGLPY